MESKTETIWRGFDLPKVIFWRGFELQGENPLEKLTGKARKNFFSLSQKYIYEYTYSSDDIYLFVGMPRKDTERVNATLILGPLSLDCMESLRLYGYGADHVEAMADCDRKAQIFSDRLMKGSQTNLVETFNLLADKWRQETLLFSNTKEIVLNESYLRIIGLGPKVVPLILNALKERDDWWFTALRTITGANPVAADDAGNFEAMRNAWLNWGANQLKL